MKYKWNGSYLICGCRWKWRMIMGRRSLKKIRASTRDSNSWRPRIPVQCSLSSQQWNHTLGGQFSEFKSSGEEWMMWSMFEIIHIWTAIVVESEEWSSHHTFSNLSNWKEKSFNKTHVEAFILQASSFQLLKLKNLLRWSLFFEGRVFSEKWHCVVMCKSSAEKLRGFWRRGLKLN